MASLKKIGAGPFRAIWDKWSAEISLALVLWVAWKFRGLFFGAGSVMDAVGTGLAGATANIAEDAKKAAQRAAIKTVNPGATNADLETFEADAEALAQACGAKSSLWINSMNTNWREAFRIARKYGRLVVRLNASHKVIATAPRADKYRLPVLYAMYKTASDGRSLMADLNATMQFAPADVQAFYAKYVK